MRENRDLIETAVEFGNFEIFTAILDKVGFKEALRDRGPYTIFAPTDQAFARVPKRRMDELLKPENRDTLQTMLRNHILFGKFMTSELRNLDKTRTAAGKELRVDSREGLRINEASVLLADLEATNGVLHGIDSVLMAQSSSATAG